MVLMVLSDITEILGIASLNLIPNPKNPHLCRYCIPGILAALFALMFLAGLFSSGPSSLTGIFFILMLVMLVLTAAVRNKHITKPVNRR
ncbi:MAG: hypothetical protein V1708_03460 [Candidatus Micrarchaeota archaeon]